MKNEIRENSIRLFSFLRELSQFRSVSIQDISSYEQVVWIGDLPESPLAYFVGRRPQGTPESSDWIRVERPKRKTPPQPPETLSDWISEDALTNSAKPLEINTSIVRVTPDPSGDPAKSTSQIINLDSVPEVRTRFDEYRDRVWAPWAAEDAVLARVDAIYKDLFSMYQAQRRMGEAFEAVLGLGLLTWKFKEQSSCRRHLVTTRVSLTLDTKRAIITVSASTDGTRLELEQDMIPPERRPPGELQATLEKDLREIGEELWDDVRVADTLKSWAQATSSDGRFTNSLSAPSDPSVNPTVTWAPALILRKQGERSFIRLYSDIIEQLEPEDAPVPVGVERLVRVMDDRVHSEGDAEGHAGDSAAAGTPGGEILFPLPFNSEQRDIAERISTHQGVVVQGPPGTGKSHTIANLICHLLASGKRILITSHTARALKVLRGKIPEALQPLCVSLLGEDQVAIQQLEDCVQGIIARQQRWNPRESFERIEMRKRELRDTRKEIARLRAELRSIRERETQKITPPTGYSPGTPSDVAQQLAIQEATHGWLMERPPIDGKAPINNSEAASLVALLRDPLVSKYEKPFPFVPNPTELLSPAEFEVTVESERSHKESKGHLSEAESSPFIAAIRRLPTDQRKDLLERFNSLVTALNGAKVFRYPWVDTCIQEVLSEQDRPWRARLDSTQKTITRCRSHAEIAIDCRVTGVESQDLDALKTHAFALVAHLEDGGGLGFGPFKKKVVKDAAVIIDQVRVDGRPCDTLPTLILLKGWLDIATTIAAAERTWGPLGSTFPKEDPLVVKLGQIEDLCEPVVRALEAHAIVNALIKAYGWLPLPNWTNQRQIELFRAGLLICDAEERLAKFQGDLSSLTAALTAKGGSTPLAALNAVTTAIRSRNVPDYRRAHIELSAVYEQIGKATVRDNLLARLHAGAPSSKALTNDARTATHASPLLHIEESWNWAKTSRWLSDLDQSARFQTLSEALEQLEDRERKFIADLAAEHSWAHCLSHLTEHQRQSLMAWQQAVKKIGKGTGKYANKWRREARIQMQECRSAIPAWILPLYRVAESLKPGVDAFDVAIIDEASQSGPEALFLHYLAKKLIVVGDDKQISPDSFLDRSSVDALRKKWLPGIPFSEYIGVDHSFFDQALIRFSGKVRLREHFRCMPEIIQFSNNLCYRSDPLIPLKQYGASRLRPTVVTRHVPDGYQEGSGGKVWNPPEAEAIVEQVRAVIKDPDCAGKTIGVISLLGEVHAKQIERKLIEAIDAEEFERREIVCGGPYSFQGDERHIMFLSLVSAPSESGRVSVLTKAEDERRFNVAASRAQDQMWLFHTPTLKDFSNENCYRYQLLRYCTDPKVEPVFMDGLDLGKLRRLGEGDRRAIRPPDPFDSWFEVDVFFNIHEQGYRVIPQYQIAGRRIDLLVEGLQGRLAVECDGDHWHGPEQFDHDMTRQRDLQRCGLSFWRVRASEYYISPEKAMQGLWRRLKEAGITTSGTHSSASPPRHPHPPAQNPSTEQASARQTNAASAPLPAAHGSPRPTSAALSLPVSGLRAAQETTKADDPPPASGTQAPDPRSSTAKSILPFLLEIISEAGPIIGEHAYKLYIKRAGLHRLSDTMIERFSEAIRLGLASKVIEEDNDHSARLIARRVYRKAGTSKVVVRPTAKRTLDEIPPSELAALLREMGAESTTVNESDLFHNVLEFYGLTRLTENAASILRSALTLTASVPGPSGMAQPKPASAPPITPAPAAAPQQVAASAPAAQPPSTQFDLPKLSAAAQLNALRQLVTWNEQARKMTNFRDYIFMGGAKNSLYRLELGQDPSPDDFRKASEALNRAQQLGFIFKDDGSSGGKT